MRAIYTLTDQEAQRLEFEPVSLVGIIEEIAYNSGSQEHLTQNLTTLRNAAIYTGHKEIFDRTLKAARQGISPDDMDGMSLVFKYTVEDFASSDEPYKEVFSLRVFGELSFREIGDLFDKNEHWACVTFHRAKTMIQNEIKEESE